LAEPETAAVPTVELAPLLRQDDAPARLASLIEQAEGDRRLAAIAAGAGNVVLPMLFAPQDDAAPPPPFVRDAAFRVVQEGAPASDLAEPPAGGHVLAPIAELGRAAATLGHVNAPLDPSGAQRLEYPVIAYGGDYFPSFSLEIARHYLDVGRDRTRLLLGQGIALGERFLPTDENMRLPINYDRPGRFPAVSAAAVLRGEVADALFADRIVLIGGTAAGIGKTFVTPFTSLMPEVERHASVVDGILRQAFLSRREASVLLDLAVVIAAGLLLGAIAQRRGMLGATVVYVLLAAGFAAANLLAFLRLGLWLNLFLPLAALTLIYLVVLAYSHFVGKRQERAIRAAFEHYLSPDLVDLVVRDPALLRLGGERRELTVLFADIRDSTTIAQRLPPDRFAALLNDVLGALTAMLFARGGMLDKFTGDGFLAIFGAPLPQPDHALRACRAALDMLAALAEVRARWPGLAVPLEVGIGINSGPMLIGNMGSAERFTYTVIGDEAHLGARLEAANKDFSTRILISEATFAQVRDRVAARELDRVRFRGLEQPVRVFELLGERPLAAAPAARLQAFEAALASYHAGDLATALAHFEALHAEAPDDHPVAIWLGRCRERLAGAGARAAPRATAGRGPYLAS
ncbi:MAG TPA: adenylate/guanylate cyclase domain-containing protein, partial [Geminicoccaceae bacterium]|nr:adenylate/guanylate cyclase domain-containing protein [Geminicoccaceae bacterium]